MTFDQREETLVGDQELAVGMGQVPGQLVTSMGGVAADHHRAGEGRPSHPEHVLGDIVEQQSDVERTRLAQRGQRRRPLGLRRGHLGVGPRSILVGETDVVVPGAVSDQSVNGLHGTSRSF